MGSLKYNFKRYHLILKTPFTISRGTTIEKDVYIVNIGEGVGEAVPTPYYGDTTGAIEFFLERVSPDLFQDPFSLEEIHDRLEKISGKTRAAKAAIDIALYDHIGKVLGLPLYKLLGIPKKPIVTSYTISIDTPENIKKQILQNPEFQVYKIKVGTDYDRDIIKAVREVTDKPIRVDANAAWDRRYALQMIEFLADHNVEFVEQPLPPWDLNGLKFLYERSPIPIIVDESSIVSTDIPKLVGRVDGINIKIQKCGGIREALKMIHTARSFNMKVMLGCMVETSVGITAALHIAPLVDYVDLDGNLLLAEDPFEGGILIDGKWQIPDLPGIGVKERK